MKPGVYSSEFWLTLVAQLVPLLVLFHAVPSADAASVTGNLNDIVKEVFAFAASALTLYKYIHSRQTLKAAAMTNDKPG